MPTIPRHTECITCNRYVAFCPHVNPNVQLDGTTCPHGHAIQPASLTESIPTLPTAPQSERESARDEVMWIPDKEPLTTENVIQAHVKPIHIVEPSKPKKKQWSAERRAKAEAYWTPERKEAHRIKIAEAKRKRNGSV